MIPPIQGSQHEDGPSSSSPAMDDANSIMNTLFSNSADPYGDSITMAAEDLWQEGDLQGAQKMIQSLMGPGTQNYKQLMQDENNVPGGPNGVYGTAIQDVLNYANDFLGESDAGKAMVVLSQLQGAVYSFSANLYNFYQAGYGTPSPSQYDQITSLTQISYMESNYQFCMQMQPPNTTFAAGLPDEVASLLSQEGFDGDGNPNGGTVVSDIQSFLSNPTGCNLQPFQGDCESYIDWMYQNQIQNQSE